MTANRVFIKTAKIHSSSIQSAQNWFWWTITVFRTILISTNLLKLQLNLWTSPMQNSFLIRYYPRSITHLLFISYKPKFQHVLPCLGIHFILLIPNIAFLIHFFLHLLVILITINNSTLLPYSFSPKSEFKTRLFLKSSKIDHQLSSGRTSRTSIWTPVFWSNRFLL